MEWINTLKEKPYFNEVAFIAAIALIIYAWKFGVEGLVGE